MNPRENKRGRSWILWILAFFLASATAMAGTTGNLTGYVTDANDAPLAGVKITVTAPVLQGSKAATTDARGFYRITQLPPGEGYKVQFDVNGYKSTSRTGVILHIGETIKLPTVKMQTQQVMEALEVIEEAPLVEQGSTSVGRTMTSDFLTKVPAGRTTTAVLQLAPGAATDAQGTTFRGATSPENNYVIDGLNTTGILYGLDSSSLPPEFIQEIQVKTGGYEPEHGRATGGQSIVITKSGGNEFHGDVFLYITPYEGPRHSVTAGAIYIGTDAATYTDPALDSTPSDPNHSTVRAARVYNQHQLLDAQIGFDLGGYIIKDRLWFFAGYAPQLAINDYAHDFRILSDASIADGGSFSDAQKDPKVSDTAPVDRRKATTHFYIGNLTYNINQDHSVRLAASGNPLNVDGVINTSFFEPGNYLGTQKGGAMDFSLNYNGKFAGGLVNLDVIMGYHQERVATKGFEGTYSNVNSPYDGMEVAGNSANVRHRYYYAVPGGCTDLEGNAVADCGYLNYLTGGVGGLAITDANRLTFKPILSIFVNNLVGNHVFKLGGDVERNEVYNKRAFTGGALADEFLRTNSADGSNYFLNQERYYSNFGTPIAWAGYDSEDSYIVAQTFTRNASAFLQDNWSLLSNLSLNLGVRWERQSLEDIQGIARIVINDNIAPRLGIIYDFTKEGKSKLYANFGRYYESIPQDINDRALSAEGFTYFRYSTLDFPDYEVGAQDISVEDADGDGAPDNPYYFTELGGEVSPVQVGLKGQYADEYLVGFEYEVAKDLSAGITGVYRTLGNVIEDISPDDGNTYIIANPGADNFNMYYAEVDESGNLSEPILADLDEDGETDVFRRCLAAQDPLTGAPTTYCFPKATRYYRAVELNMNKRFSGNWVMQASYTWSQTYGNYPGLFAQSRGQLDPNITSQFDIPSLIANRYGFLDTDRRHLLKLAGSYAFDFGGNIGLTANIQSGIPVLYLGAHPVYSGGEAFIVPRASQPSDGPSDLSVRTPPVLRIDANARYEITLANKDKVGLGFQVNNILNADKYERVDPNYTDDVANPAVGGTDLNQVQCYDPVNYLPVLQCERRPNNGAATGYQAPLSVRLEVKYSF